jgi:hypothetical protein
MRPGEAARFTGRGHVLRARRCLGHLRGCPARPRFRDRGHHPRTQRRPGHRRTARPLARPLHPAPHRQNSSMDNGPAGQTTQDAQRCRQPRNGTETLIAAIHGSQPACRGAAAGPGAKGASTPGSSRATRSQRSLHRGTDGAAPGCRWSRGGGPGASPRRKACTGSTGWCGCPGPDSRRRRARGLRR